MSNELNTVDKELSQFAGVALSSPFASAIFAGEYDYDDFVGEEGFIKGFSDRVAKAGTIDAISEGDRTFADICQKSIEIADKMKTNVIGVDEREEILDQLIELGLIEPQISYANN